MKFGDFLKKQREGKEWTQPQAADAIGIEQSYLSKLENNKAIPSPEIFDKLMSAYQFEMKQLGEMIHGSELDRLKDIVLVRDFIITHKKQSEGVRRNWLLAGLVMMMLGVGLATHGAMSDADQQTRHLYESKGEIKQGESHLLFAEMPSYRRYSSTMQDSNTSSRKIDLVESPLFKRLDYQQLFLNEYQGEFFDKQDRRFILVSSEKSRDNSSLMLLLSVGSMLLVGGLVSLFISRRW
ncbi:MAG: helix-turn-helix domain-containing protein [Alteromonadaceae bacterium]|nr:helix-turn-helix domain-containing protein [Alteromonadaceae bacterium]